MLSGPLRFMPMLRLPRPRRMRQNRGVNEASPLRAAGYPFVAWTALVASVASMTWLAFFVGGVAVPKGIDDGPLLPAPRALAVDVALFAAFAVTHSLLARPSVKRRLARLWPQPLERALYSLVAAIQVSLLMLFWRPLPEVVWSAPPGPLPALLWILQAAGWAIVIAALAALGGRGLTEFFGIEQARAAVAGRPFVPGSLVAHGVYRFIRHPLYAGTLLAFWSAPVMSRGRLLFALTATLYLAIGHRLEERQMLREHGDAFRQYRERVPGFLPLNPKGRKAT